MDIMGEYVVPFSFELPANSPASMYFKNRDDKHRRKGMIKYSVRATLTTESGKDQISYKQIVVVQNKLNVPMLKNISQSSMLNIKTGCCVDQGRSGF